jgi:hypothetical protein
MLLKFRLTKNEFQILEQDKEYFNDYYYQPNEWTIETYARPKINIESNTIYLRGNYSKKDNIICHFDKQYYMSIMDTFISFCKQKKFKLFEVENNIYEIQDIYNDN